MEIIFTKDSDYKKKWNDFVLNNDRGSHLLLTDWLQSYKNYGFDYELCLAIENEEIIAGYGAVIAKFLFFKFYIIPYGPIDKTANGGVLKLLIDAIAVRAKKIKACYCQFNFPMSSNASFSNHYYQSIDETLFKNYKKGNLFKFVYSSNGLNWIDLKKYTTEEEILIDFKSTVRRDIRSALRKEQEIKFLTAETDIKQAYDLCLENAKNGNYSLRDWASFKETILKLVQNDKAKFIAAYKDNEIKGAIFLVKSGNYYSYILGGTKKEKPDLLTGHLLQWEAIKLSFNENLDGYNISLGGSDGVKEFKSNFNTTAVDYIDTKYFVVINAIIFKFFLFFEEKVRPLKKNIAKILSVLKK
ncbi:lipid II:glycine glycyltransferase FemX [Flavobacterium sp.]|uniref:lipid II:glycine glycyltransferase FemX n=1 Tax=Flavobacterium sp. TaxID=239 RepID=UPI0037504285